MRQALADVRATASGMQTVRAATEIASARTILSTVGIQAKVPTAVPPLPEDLAELFGYVIREGVTNIVRHSRATRARITVEEDAVTVADDGIGIPRRLPHGRRPRPASCSPGDGSRCPTRPAPGCTPPSAPRPSPRSPGSPGSPA